MNYWHSQPIVDVEVDTNIWDHCGLIYNPGSSPQPEGWMNKQMPSKQGKCLKLSPKLSPGYDMVT